MMELEAARKFFANDVFATRVAGIEIVETGEHYARCRMPLDDRHYNAAGAVMGGAIFTLADFVFAVSENQPDKFTVTSVSQISFLSAPKGKVLFGESRLLKDGKRACFYEITVKDELGNLCAIASTNGTHL